MKIGFFESGKAEEEYFTKKFSKNNVLFFEEKLQDVPIKDLKELEGVCVFIYSKLDEKLLSKMVKLKAVFTRSTGLDHIDLEFCKKRRIEVYNVPLYGVNSVSEHTFSLILALSRRLIDFSLKSNSEYSPFDLSGKTIGVLGTGNIGKNVIKIAKGFGMNCLAFDIVENKKLEEEIGFRYVSLNELLEKSDVVSLHLPLNEKTFHIIGEREIKTMKKQAILINCSRGGLLDSFSLIYALEKGDLFGAGLDVIENEEEIFAKKKSNLYVRIEKLIDSGRLILTPHIAFNSKESLNSIFKKTEENILNFLK